MAAILGVPVMVAWMRASPAFDFEARARRYAERVHARWVPIQSVAPSLLRAVIDTEDERFYRHHGIDLTGVARAAAFDVSHLTLRQGASTITEQVAKLLYLGGNDHSPWRKVEDAAIAWQVESAFAKPQILDAYLNTVYFGNGAYGVSTASAVYFGVTAGGLSLGQATMLAGLIQAPSAYDPLAHPEAARLRQDDVLLAMIRHRDLSAGLARAVLDRPLALVGGTAIPARVDPVIGIGPAVAPFDLALAAGLAGFGVAWLAVRRRFVLSSVLLCGGVLLAARSFRVA